MDEEPFKHDIHLQPYPYMQFPLLRFSVTVTVQRNAQTSADEKENLRDFIEIFYTVLFMWWCASKGPFSYFHFFEFRGYFVFHLRYTTEGYTVRLSRGNGYFFVWII